MARIGETFSWFTQSGWSVCAGSTLWYSSAPEFASERVGRALHEKVPLIKTINRLSRQLNRAGLWANITAGVLQLARGKVDEQTLLVIAISDISKVIFR